MAKRLQSNGEREVMHLRADCYGLASVRSDDGCQTERDRLAIAWIKGYTAALRYQRKKDKP